MELLVKPLKLMIFVLLGSKIKRFFLTKGTAIVMVRLAIVAIDEGIVLSNANLRCNYYIIKYRIGYSQIQNTGLILYKVVVFVVLRYIRFWCGRLLLFKERIPHGGPKA